MATQSHFMIDTLLYLAPPLRPPPQSAADEIAAVAARQRLAAEQQPERRRAFESGRNARGGTHRPGRRWSLWPRS
jgi:hypothetical protein